MKINTRFELVLSLCFEHVKHFPRIISYVLGIQDSPNEISTLNDCLVFLRENNIDKLHLENESIVVNFEWRDQLSNKVFTHEKWTLLKGYSEHDKLQNTLAYVCLVRLEQCHGVKLLEKTLSQTLGVSVEYLLPSDHRIYYAREASVLINSGYCVELQEIACLLAQNSFSPSYKSQHQTMLNLTSVSDGTLACLMRDSEYFSTDSQESIYLDKVRKGWRDFVFNQMAFYSFKCWQDSWESFLNHANTKSFASNVRHLSLTSTSGPLPF